MLAPTVDGLFSRRSAKQVPSCVVRLSWWYSLLLQYYSQSLHAGAPSNTFEHGLQASVEHDSAAKSVLRLLSNSMLPESSKVPILYQAIPLMERQELPPLFSAKDTSKLLAHLQVSFLMHLILLAAVQA